MLTIGVHELSQNGGLNEQENKSSNFKLDNVNFANCSVCIRTFTETISWHVAWYRTWRIGNCIICQCNDSRVKAYEKKGIKNVS